MKILFALHDLGFADHIAIAHLSAIAQQSGHQTYFTMLDKLLPTIDEIKPRVVAYSVNIIGYKRVIAANAEARKRHKFIAIMGGAHPTVSPETFAESGMDAYCVGEGDYVFRDFLANIGDFSNVPNLITVKGAVPIRPLIVALDELPLADRDLILANSFLGQATKKTFFATRGCPFSCAYCCNNYYHKLYRGKGPLVRRFSVERVISEIEYVRSRYRCEFVKFGDDCFTIQADEWLEEFASEYIRRINLPFNCYLRIDMVDDRMLRLLKRAGCYSVNVSVDSTSHYIREHILHRRMRAENIVERLRKLKEYGINTFCNYMLAAPESTLEDDLSTIRQGREGKITWMNYTTTVPMEKTELYDYCLQHQIIKPDYQGDMGGCMERSELACFSNREKDIRFNVFLMGDFLSKLPPVLAEVGAFLIRVLPPNWLFRKFNAWRYRRSMEHDIFVIKDKFTVPRFWQRSKANATAN